MTVKMMMLITDSEMAQPWTVPVLACVAYETDKHNCVKYNCSEKIPLYNNATNSLPCKLV